MAATTGEDALLAPSLDALDAELARRSLRRYVEMAWPLVEPGREFKANWHIDAICEHLEAVSHREIRNLIINIPPRGMKSLLTSVFWPTWTWLREPNSRWLFASYAERLAVRDARKSRAVLRSEGVLGADASKSVFERIGYQGVLRLLWGDDAWQFAGDQNVKSRYENNATGYRLSTSWHGSATGEGGDYRVVDDPHKPDEITSDVVRESDLDWYDQTWSSRGIDPATDVEVVIMQRLHEGDLTGHLLGHGDWEQICLPAEYEPSHPFVWPDDRRGEKGELLWPDRFPEEFLERQRTRLGSYGYSGQYQQRPSPEEGGILKRHWWRFYKPPAPPLSDPALKEIVQSWDCAFKDEEANDYVVGQLWLRDLADKYLLAMIAAKLDLPNTVRAVLALEAYARDLGYGPHRIFIEETANGPAVIQTLRKRIAGIVPVKVPDTAKVARVHAVAPQVEARNVILPEGIVPAPKAPTGENGKPLWVATRTDALVDECANFPNVVNDDMVDALAQALTQIDKRQGAGAIRTGGYRPGHLSDR